MVAYKSYLDRIIQGQSLSRAEAYDAFARIMSGEVTPAMIGGLLAALATKGESTDEISGAADAMRQHVQSIRCDDPRAIDTCGTGGDGVSTFNVSTTAAIIAAAAGATVAKHGNRTRTRVSGSAEVLQALCVNIEADTATVERCLADVGIGFLFAAALHPALRHAGPVRQALGVRTIFNLLGPLANPAGVRRQIIGVPESGLTETLASVLGDLGAEHVWVVHGAGGICDLSIVGPTRVTELRDGRLRTFTVEPQACGFEPAALSTLLVADPAGSAAAVRAILAGEPGPRREHALLNAGAAVHIAGLADDLADGVRLAVGAVDSGQAADTLQRLAAASQDGTTGAHAT